MWRCFPSPSDGLRPGFPASLAKEAGVTAGARSGPVPPSCLLPGVGRASSLRPPARPSSRRRRDLPGPAGMERMGAGG